MRRRGEASVARLERSALARFTARVLVLTLLAQGAPVDFRQRAVASTEPSAGAPRSSGGTLHVEAQAATACRGKTPCFATIQAAIDAVGPGERIEIQAGEYVEQLRIRRKNAHAGASEADRIVIEADPSAAVGSVVLRGSRDGCESGFAVEVERSRYLTLRGLSIVGAGARGIGLRGGSAESRGIHIERNRLARGGPRQCNGGIDVGRGNPDTVIANNLIYANGRNGIRFRDGRGGSYYVIGNTIARNAWSGVQIARASVAELVNNVIVHNGQAPGATASRVGVRRRRSSSPDPRRVRLLGNVLCGNRGGELVGTMLDVQDAANLTPTGLEGPGVAASPACDRLDALLGDHSGPDGKIDTDDDDFALAQGSAATDAGVDPRGMYAAVPAALLEADFAGLAARPRDGDGDGVAAFDAGALEGPGGAPPTPSPSPTASASPTPSPWPTTSPSPSPSPSASPTPAENTPPDLIPPGDRRIVVGQAFSTRLFAFDRDPGDVVSFGLPELPPEMTVDPQSGEVAWLPTEADLGRHAVTASATDRAGATDAESFSVTVVAAAAPPVVGQAPRIDPLEDVTIAVGDSLALRATAFDPDPGDLLTFSLPAAPLGMTISSSGELAWTPSASQVGRHDCTVQVSDPGGLVATESFTVTVQAADAAPLAADDTYEVRAGETLAVPAAGVLENDRDPRGDPLAAALVEAPANGTLDLRPDGAFEYTPAAPSRRTDIGVDLARWDTPEIVTSGTYGSSDEGSALDRDTSTSWLAADRPAVYYELAFESRDVTVRRLRMVGNRNPEEGMDFLSGVFQLFDRGGGVLYDSGEVALPDPGDVELDVGEIAGVHRVRFTGVSWESHPGFAELEVIGSAEVLDVREEWAWTSSAVRPDDLQVSAAPVVGDLDGDGAPEIVFASYASSDLGGTNYKAGYLRAVHGRDGSEAFTVTSHRVLASSQPAIGDIDGDGRAEILILADDANHLLAFEHDGTHKWTGPNLRGQNGGELGGPALADLDGDGSPEIVVGENDGVTVLAADGTTRWVSPSGGSGGHTLGKLPFAVDLDLDGAPEILAGNTAYTAAGAIRWKNDALPDGFTAVGNFDDDAYPEIVLVAPNRDGNPVVRLLEHDGQVIWSYVARTTTRGGPPTVADFDSDGKPEVGFAARHVYTILDGDGTLLWAEPVLDATSGVTGSTAFDLDGDGGADVVYADERYLYVFRGRDGQKLFRTELGSGTLYEYPVVADVDADGHAEIVAVANHGSFGANPSTHRGVYVFGGAHDDWTRTRPVWNQHTYHVTNVGTDLAIPPFEQPSWLLAGLNDFRRNAFAPDEAGSADRFTYRASDGANESNEATVFLEILPPNTAPEIVSQPTLGATVGFPYAYGVRAVDVEGDPLVYSLVEAPAGMTIDAASGAVRWAPGQAQLGDHRVAVRVVDDQGFAGAQAFTVRVAAAVRVPEVLGLEQAAGEASLAGAGLATGAIATASHAIVPAGVVAEQAPAGGSLAEPGSAVALVVSLGPGPGDLDEDGDGFSASQGDCDDGDSAVHPGAADAAGNGIDEDCDGADASRPLAEIIVAPASPSALVGAQITFTATGVFDDGTSQDLTALVAWESLSPATASVDTAGVASALAAGSATIRATRGGASGSAVLAVSDAVAGDATQPLAEISLPAADSTVTAPVEIVGTASDDSFLDYELALAPTGEPSFTTIASSTTPVVAGVLGTLDPTLLVNDLYTVRLSVRDRGGNVAVAEAVYQVEGQLKVGLLALSFVDLRVAMAGLPIVVERTYDSRERRSGDFGFGWRLAVQSLRLRANRMLGTGWWVRRSRLAYQILPSDAHRMSLTLPGGEVEQFDLELTPNPSVIVPFSSVSASFRARPGTRGSLECLDDTALLVVGAQPGEVTLTDFAARTFDPQRFRYTAADGTRYVIHRRDGVESVTERNGNTVTFGPGGIVHSAGRSVLFQRDAQGRITSITDPNGNVQTYVYDANGDLRRHTDAEGGTTGFSYDRRHGLLHLDDPLGRRIVRNEYDAAGRLVATVDADGKRIEYTHDIAARQEAIRDRRGEITTYAYDDRGSLLRKTDPLGHTWSYAYDAAGNRTSETDPLGQTTTWSHDAAGNETARTDALGHTTTFARAASGQLLSIASPGGGTTTGAYDARGNQIEKTGPEGATRRFAYDSAGNLVHETDCGGGSRAYAYDVGGRLIEEIDPLGHRTTHTHDANGNRLTTTRSRTTPSGTATMVTRFAYDGRNRLVRTTHPDGAVTRTEYDALGRVAAEVDASGRRTSYEYDVTGNRVGVTHPDGTTARSTWDAEGRQTSETDRAGRTRAFEYDAAGRTTRIVHPDGSASALEYDAAGRLAATTDPRGGRSELRWDAAGHQTAVIDPLGGRTDFAYDAAGNRVGVTDAGGKHTTYRHDAAGRVVETVFPDGTTARATHQAGCGGRTLTATDQTGATTRFDYDALGRLARVTDALGSETVFAYDEVGNRISQTDANGNVTRWEHDDRGRVTRRISPLGTFASYGYDVVGHLTATTDARGNTVAFVRDSMGRVVEKRYPDGAVTRFTYEPGGEAATVEDARGLTTYDYDAVGRLARATQPDGASLAYGYDAAGNRTSVEAPSGTTLYAYDAANRLASVTDADGGVASFSHDAAGHRTGETLPNGVQTTYARDDLGRVVRLEHRASGGSLLAAYEYAYGPTGDRLVATESSGRTVRWTYDALHRLIEERVSDGGGAEATTAYTYDAVGNRLTRTDSSGTRAYTYDANDRLLDDGAAAYAYDADGNAQSRSEGSRIDVFDFDADGRLAAAQVAGKSAEYAYDERGLRTSARIDGALTRYLVDRNRDYAQVLEERDAAGALLARHDHADHPLAQSRDGSRRWLLRDAHGSTRALADPSGALTDTYDYDAFGATTGRSGTTRNDLLYAGEQLDPALGDYYLRARYYDPATGRFLSPDPRAGDPRDPLSLHRYLYAHDNPVTRLDPSGETSVVELGLAISILLLAAETMVVYGLLRAKQAVDAVRWDGWIGAASIGEVAGGGVAAASLRSQCLEKSHSPGQYWQGRALVDVTVFGVTLGPLPVGLSWGGLTMELPGPMGVYGSNFGGFASFVSATATLSTPLQIFSSDPAGGGSVGRATMGHGIGQGFFGWVRGWEVGVSSMGGFAIPFDWREECMQSDARTLAPELEVPVERP